MLSAYAVKHIIEDEGEIKALLPDIKKEPRSFTSKRDMAEGASKGNFVYVIEVERMKNETLYRLSYKYKARESFEGAGGKKWRDKFTYKNTIRYGVPSEGMYFEEPVFISNPDFQDWYKTETLGMCHIEEQFVLVLEELFSDPVNKAQHFKV